MKFLKSLEKPSRFETGEGRQGQCLRAEVRDLCLGPLGTRTRRALSRLPLCRPLRRQVGGQDLAWNLSSDEFHNKLVFRVAALLDVAQVSDVLEVKDDKTFVRPMYAGNAIATVESADAVKVFTVRPTVFDKAARSGGSAEVKGVAPTFQLRASRPPAPHAHQEADVRPLSHISRDC